MARAKFRFQPAWYSDTNGNVAITFALAAVVLMLAVGAAVDIGRWLHARDQTVGAVDAAVLAGGRWLQTNPSDDAGAVAAAQNYYNENVVSRLPIVNDTVAFAVASDKSGVFATGSAFIKTPFLQLANISELPLFSTSQTVVAQSRFRPGSTNGNNVAQSLEVSLMLDITGSMLEYTGTPSTQKLDDLKAAATDFVNIVVLDDQSQYSTKVAVVPFSEDIRLPTTAALQAARGTQLPSSVSIPTGSGKNQKTTTYYLSDCVVERMGTQKYTDAAPGAGQYVMGHYTTNSTGSGNNKKGVCTIPSGAEVMPLTSDKTALTAKISGLSASGGTAGHLGTAWAWYTLSPNWNSLWPSNGAAAYGNSNLQKVAVLMTDGEYNTQYDSNGISVNQNATTCPQAANGCSTAQALSLCSAMKTAGIVVYTVGVGLGSNQTAVDTLTQCASEPAKFCNAADGTQLRQCFHDIALKQMALFISQ